MAERGPLARFHPKRVVSFHPKIGAFMLEAKVREIEGRSAQEGWSYPKLFDALKGAGIQSYETDVPRFEITYFGAGEQYRKSPPQGFSPGTAASHFDVQAIKKAIQRIGRGETTYPQFLEEIAAAGVHTYRVDMSARTVTYKSAH